MFTRLCRYRKNTLAIVRIPEVVRAVCEYDPFQVRFVSQHEPQRCEKQNVNVINVFLCDKLFIAYEVQWVVNSYIIVRRPSPVIVFL